MFGIVTKYDRVSAYGFILPDDPAQPDFFVCPKLIIADKHHRFLVPGQRVEFDPVEVDGKTQAHNVRVIPVIIARQTSAEGPR